VPRPVSPEFAREFEALTKLRMEPTGAIVPPDAGGEGRTGVAYSGGVDSTATVGLLPPDTALVYAFKGPPNGLGRKNQQPATRASEGALESCRSWRRLVARWSSCRRIWST
jgi:hypothetical protein